VAAGITGIVSLVVAFIPFIDFVSIPGGIVAIILGIVGVNRAKEMGGTSRGMAITGIVTGAVAIGLVIIFIALVYSYFGTHLNQFTFPSFTPFPT
jgi:Na+/H+-dicarboxylate symporter